MPDIPPETLLPPGNFAELVGYTLTGWGKDSAEISLTVDERHLNRNNILHGGIMGTLIDTACGYSGCYPEPPEPGGRAMTLSLNIQFVAAAAPGARLTAVARRTGGGKTIFFATCEVRGQDGRLFGQGQGTFKYRRRPDAAPTR